MTRLVGYTGLEAQDAWEEAENFLRPALAEDDVIDRLVSTKARVLSGLNILWRIETEEGKTEAWATTNGYTEDGKTKIIQIHIASAETYEAFLKVADLFYLKARESGYHYVEVVGRIGWVRKLKDHGFIHNYTSLLKPLDMEIH